MAAVTGAIRIIAAGAVGHVVLHHGAGVVQHQHDVGLDVGRAPVGQGRGGDVGAGRECLVADSGEERRSAENAAMSLARSFLSMAGFP